MSERLIPVKFNYSASVIETRKRNATNFSIADSMAFPIAEPAKEVMIEVCRIHTAGNVPVSVFSYSGKLWRTYTQQGKDFVSVDDFLSSLASPYKDGFLAQPRYLYGSADPVTKDAISVKEWMSDNRNETINRISNELENYLIYEGSLYTVTQEPCYHVKNSTAGGGSLELDVTVHYGYTYPFHTGKLNFLRLDQKDVILAAQKIEAEKRAWSSGRVLVNFASEVELLHPEHLKLWENVLFHLRDEAKMQRGEISKVLEMGIPQAQKEVAAFICEAQEKMKAVTDLTNSTGLQSNYPIDAVFFLATTRFERFGELQRGLLMLGMSPCITNSKQGE